IPIAVSFGHIAPGRAGAQHPKNAVDHSPLVGNGRTPFATIRKQGVENAPFRVRQIAATQCCLPQKGSLESKLDSSVKNRQHDLAKSQPSYWKQSKEPGMQIRLWCRDKILASVRVDGSPMQKSNRPSSL